VEDYYLSDSRQRLESVIGKLTSALGMKPSSGDGLITPAQLGNYLRELAHILDTDPHFRYEVSVGPTKSYIASEPGMVFTTLRTTGPDNSNAVTVRVFTRFKAALEFRPIPINVVIRAQPGSDLQQELANSPCMAPHYRLRSGPSMPTWTYPADSGVISQEPVCISSQRTGKQIRRVMYCEWLQSILRTKLLRPP
jgi:hypothetical protein